MEHNLRPPSHEDQPLVVEPLSHRVIHGAARTTLDAVPAVKCFTGRLGILGMLHPGTVATAGSVVAGVEQRTFWEGRNHFSLEALFIVSANDFSYYVMILFMCRYISYIHVWVC